MTYKVTVPGCTASFVEAKSSKEARSIVTLAKKIEIDQYRRSGYTGWADRLVWKYTEPWVIEDVS